MITIDMEAGVISLDEGGTARSLPFASPEAFALMSKIWLRVGWDTKYVYSFTWMGRPIIQLPEDVLRVQEVVFALRPDVIVETGVAHGGSLVFYASLCKAMGRGRVIGVDVEIRPHNRAAIEAHELFDRITLIEGSSIDPAVVDTVKSLVAPGESVLVILDSNHTKAHVAAELQAYSSLVPPGSYIVAADGLMGELAGAPRTNDDWVWNNPKEAAAEFVAAHDDFVLEPPVPQFNEGVVDSPVSYWVGGWVKRVR